MTPIKASALQTKHRTKQEIKARELQEAAALSGVKLKERADVRADPVAHKQFKRVCSLLAAIGKDDDLYGTVLNDYCLMYSRVQKLNELAEAAALAADPELYLRLVKQSQIIQRDMRSIEDKNFMNATSAMRGVPPKPAAKASDALREVLAEY